MGYSFLLALIRLCALSHRQDNTYHSLCYTSRGALAGTINSVMKGILLVIVPSLFHIYYFFVQLQYEIYLQPKRKEENVTMIYSTHFISSYMASDIWLRTILIVRKETRCCHIGYSFRLAARVLLYAPSHRQDSSTHGLC